MKYTYVKNNNSNLKNAFCSHTQRKKKLITFVTQDDENILNEMPN